MNRETARRNRSRRTSLLFWAGVLATALQPTTNLPAQERSSLTARIQAITTRPEYRHSRFGMQFYSLADRKIIYELNPDQLFIPGSTGKLFPAATALATLGPDHRFRTKVYRTGPVVDGVLRGDLVLVASGDLNLSNRIRADGTLAFTEVDHSYDQVPGAKPVDGDPLEVIDGIAGQIAARGIRRIEGRVLVDASLFRLDTWPPGMSNAVLSPIVVNDNVIDLTVRPGAREGEPGLLGVSPETSYVRFVNRTKTVTGPGNVQLVNDIPEADGTRTVTVAGTVTIGHSGQFRAYRIPEPDRFAATVLVEALRRNGIEARTDLRANADVKTPAASYRPTNQIAEHVSPPLSEAVKIVLKVSQNVHAATLPYLLGAIVSKDGERANQAGFAHQRKLFEAAGLDLTAAAQSDGAGIGSRFTPDFTVRFLEYVSRQPYFRAFFDALPIMGKDGSLADVQKESPAAGRVRAKTGTDGGADFVRQAAFLNGKGLGGYIELPDGRLVAFGLYANFVPVGDFAGMMRVGEALGEIVSAVYESLVEERGTGRARG